MCEVPLADAPILFGVVQDPEGYPHCFVKQQPVAEVELGQMILAIRHAELGCIRYRGADRLVQLRLSAFGEQSVCDNPFAETEPEATVEGGNR